MYTSLEGGGRREAGGRQEKGGEGKEEDLLSEADERD